MPLTENNIDKSSIDELTNAFFSIFTNLNGKEPDWNLLQTTCLPQTIIIKKSGLNEVVYNLKTFIEPRQKILTDGTLTGFVESEIEETTVIIGNIAQRSSRYRKSGFLDGCHFEEFGNKFFQFIRTVDGWKINALIWEDDAGKS